MELKLDGSYAFIFDLDGVLVDTSKHHYLAWKELAKKFDFDLTESLNEQLKGVSRAESLELILNEVGVNLPAKEKLDLTNKKNEIYLSSLSELNETDLLTGVKEFLLEALGRKIPMAVGSASKNARHILSKVGILSYFSEIVDGNMVTNGKPDPEVFLLAARELNHPANFCVVFEDSIKGIEAGHRAQMKVVGIGLSKQLKEADLVYNGFQNLKVDEIINRMNKL